MKQKGSILLAVGILALIGLTYNRKVWATPPAGQVYEPVFKEAETANGLPAGLLSRMAYQESRYNPNARGADGEIGIMQIIPRFHPNVNPSDPIASIFYAARLMRDYYNRLGSWEAAIAAYNWGITNVIKYGAAAAPSSTKAYIAGVLSDIGLAGIE